MESGRTINLGGENKSDKMSEKMSEFIKSPIGKFAVGMMVVIVVAGGIAAEKYLNRDKTENEVTNTPPQQEQQIPLAPEQANPATVVEDTGSQAEVVESVEKIPTVEELEMDPSLLDDPDEFIKNYTESTMTSWINAGATPENAKLASENWYKGISKEDTAKQIADEYDDIYINALLSKEWQSSSNMREYVDIIKKIHSETIYVYLLTSNVNGGSPEDEQPYRMEIKLTKTIHKQYKDKSVTFTNTQHYVDNSDKNRAGKEWNSGVKAQEKYPIYIFGMEENGKGVKKIKLTGISL